MSKLGLITIYYVPNYGSVLQCFATQTILTNIGHECKIIKYHIPNKWHLQNGYSKPNRIKKLIRLLFPTKKTLVLNNFRNKYLNFTKEYSSLSALQNENWEDYDGFVAGSDQIWNIKHLLGDKAFLLSFVPNSKKRYSFASSFALKSLPEKYRKKFAKELSQFSAISVRENNAINIIHNELSINKLVDVILDPTLLLSKEDWIKAIPRSSFIKKNPYILFYMWTYAFEPRPYIFEVTKYFKEKLGWDVIALEGYTSIKESQFKMDNKSNATIEEFIDLFNNADMVITSSFHGTAFALNFGIPLLSIVPNNNEDDRQTTLLKKIGVDNCITNIGQGICLLNPYYNSNDEQKKLAMLRKESLTWIEKNIQ